MTAPKLEEAPKKKKPASKDSMRRRQAEQARKSWQNPEVRARRAKAISEGLKRKREQA